MREPLPKPDFNLDTTRKFTFIISNLSKTEKGKYVLFGWNEYGQDENAGSSDFVSIGVSQTSHGRVKRDFAGGTYIGGDLKLRCENINQFSNEITWHYHNLINGKKQVLILLQWIINLVCS